MADVNCPLPAAVTHDAVKAAYRAVKKEMPQLGIGPARREASRRMGLDYKHYMDVWERRIPSLKPSIISPTKVTLPRTKAVSRVATKATPKLPDLTRAMQAAEDQRLALEKARYIQSGKGKGSLNSSNGYTRDRAVARQEYSESMNTAMNGLLRDPEAFAKSSGDTMVAYADGKIKLVEELLQRNEITEDIVVSRVMTGNFSRVREGELFADPGFLSTTTDVGAFLAQPSAAFEAGTAAGEQFWTFVIQVPKGTRALPGAGYQKEIFFGPGTKQEIISVDKRARTIYTRIVK